MPMPKPETKGSRIPKEGHITSKDSDVKDVKKRTKKFIITTKSTDRDDDIVYPKGLDTSNFMKNPVVLFAHDQRNLPVGKAIGINRTKDSIEAEVEFLPEGVDEVADKVYTLVDLGFLKGASIGFKPTEYDYVEERGVYGGYDITKSELLEFSIVPVPSNPEALAKSYEEGNKFLRKWAKDILDYKEEKEVKEEKPVEEEVLKSEDIKGLIKETIKETLKEIEQEKLDKEKELEEKEVDNTINFLKQIKENISKEEQ